jgi:signal transduction histidine kinase
MVAGNSASDMPGCAQRQGTPDAVARLLLACERLHGSPAPDFGPILAAVTPEGAASFLIRNEDSDAVVVAAYGLPASPFIGVRRARSADDGPAELLTSFSASGRVVGARASAEHVAGLGPGFKAGLGVRLAGQDGRCLGHLHLLDPVGERILEPAAVELARLAARQIALAIDNRDLAELVEAERAEVARLGRQLAEASKLGAVGELAAAVAHEVNNPLTGILGFAELLLSELPANDPRRADARVIMTEAVRARSIVRALLEFARPRPPQRIQSDLNEVARGAVELVRFRAQEAGVWIVEEFADIPHLELDPDAFKQVLLNLFDNALESMPHGGRLRVRTRRQGDRAGVVVADNGVGMDAETRRHIFTPFFSTRGANRGGTGLGLSVSLQIIQGHCGTIEVESEPGKGTSFVIWLPIVQPSFDGAVLLPGAGPGLESRLDRPGEQAPASRRSAGRRAGRRARSAEAPPVTGSTGRGEAA